MVYGNEDQNYKYWLKYP